MTGCSRRSIPTTRAFEHDGKRYLVTDTVGFIRRLPTQLVEGFAATLEETLVADLVLHVADASLPEDRLRETIDAVHAVLAEIGADDVPVELVLNKVDLLDPLARRRMHHAFPRALQHLGRHGRGARRAQGAYRRALLRPLRGRAAARPVRGRALLAQLYGLGAPIAERRDTPEGVRVRARLPRSEIPRFAQFLVAGRDRRRGRRRGDRGRAFGACATTRCCRGRPTRATRGSTSPRARASCSRPGERAVVPTGVAVEIPGGLRGVRAAALGPRGAPRDHDRQLARARRLRLPRRDLVVLLNTDRDERVHRRAGTRIAQLVVSPVAAIEPRGGGGAGRERAGRARLRVVGRRVGEPRIRVSAILRWRGRILLLRHEKARRSLAAARRRRPHRREPAARAAARAVGGDRAVPRRHRGAARGPGRARRLDRSLARARSASTSCT